jgi:hypothetical protein
MAQEIEYRGPLGNIRQVLVKATFAGTSDTIETGLRNCVGAWPTQIGPAGGTVDNTVQVFANFSDAGSMAAPGKVFINGVTIGGVYSIRCVGV